MTRYRLMLLLPWLIALQACGSSLPATMEPQPAAPEPAPVLAVSPTPLADTPPKAKPTIEPVAPTEPVPQPPTGLRVVYLKGGNLWSWTEAAGSAQLTGTGDMSTARLSHDGQLLAFMRGRDVWSVRMDGTEARLLSTQSRPGAALWFVPNDAMLTVSTADHIDLIDLTTLKSNTVVTYPAVPNDYSPEVTWTLDALGFKTVIPPQTESGQAEMLFVFTTGTVASLAKFAMVPTSASQPFLSPDGGYLIYVAKVGSGQQSLYLMDSSGATRPYGEPADKVQAYGWLPDSQHFVFASSQQTMLGDVLGGLPVDSAIGRYDFMRWVDMEHFVALDKGDLYLGSSAGERTLIDTQVAGFDFTQ